MLPAGGSSGNVHTASRSSRWRHRVSFARTRAPPNRWQTHMATVVCSSTERRFWSRLSLGLCRQTHIHNLYTEIHEEHQKENWSESDFWEIITQFVERFVMERNIEVFKSDKWVQSNLFMAKMERKYHEKHETWNKHQGRLPKKVGRPLFCFNEVEFLFFHWKSV